MNNNQVTTSYTTALVNSHNFGRKLNHMPECERKINGYSCHVCLIAIGIHITYIYTQLLLRTLQTACITIVILATCSGSDQLK